MTSLTLNPSSSAPGWIAIVVIIGTSLEEPPPALGFRLRLGCTHDPDDDHGGVVLAAAVDGQVDERAAGGVEVVAGEGTADLGQVDLAPQPVGAEKKAVPRRQRFLAN